MMESNDLDNKIFVIKDESQSYHKIRILSNEIITMKKTQFFKIF